MADQIPPDPDEERAFRFSPDSGERPGWIDVALQDCEHGARCPECE